MVKINLKGREIPLLYTTFEMLKVQEEIAPLNQFIPKILGGDPTKKGKETDSFGSAEHLRAIAKAVVILGNSGLEEAGETPDLDDKKVLKALKPSQIAGVVNACMDALNEGMSSEVPEKKDDGPVDVVLEDMKKKETPES